VHCQHIVFIFIILHIFYNIIYFITSVFVLCSTPAGWWGNA